MVRPQLRAGAGEAGRNRDPAVVLADVLRRDDAVLSATEMLPAELSSAHLGVLGPIWHDLVRSAQATRFGQALGGALRAAAAGDPACTWLWRSLRVRPRPQGWTVPACSARWWRPARWTGARDIARVLDSRVRLMIECAPPVARGPRDRGGTVTADRRHRTG